MYIRCSQQWSKSYLTASEIAVVIRLRLSETCKSGKMQTSLRILIDHSLYNLQKFNHSQNRFWREAAEIHMRSLIGECIYMRIYMNSAVLMPENVAGKNVYAKSVS